MNNEDYIRAAIELADGWALRKGPDHDFVLVDFEWNGEQDVDDMTWPLAQFWIDALGAQLWRQVMQKAWQENETSGWGPAYEFLHKITDCVNALDPYYRPEPMFELLKLIVDSRVLSDPDTGDSE